MTKECHLSNEEIDYIIKVGSDPKNLDIDCQYLVQDVINKYPRLKFHIVHEAMILALIGVEPEVISAGINSINRDRDV